MSNPTVSIIVPVYNIEKYFDKCMESLLGQTLKNMEFILVDDGSTDNSGALCDKYARMDERVRVFHKVNGGVSSARNLALQHVKGQYLAFVDPDDWVELDAYARLVRDMEENQADIVFFGYDEVSEIKTETEVIVHSPEKRGEGDAKEGIRQMMLGIGKGYFTLIANKLLKTELCIDANGLIHRFDETIAVGEDGLWLVDVVVRANKVYFDSKVFYHWLIRENSACHIKSLTPERLSAIESQRRIIDKVACYGEEIIKLAEAKVYHDSFSLLVTAYREKNNDVFGQIVTELKPYRHVFFRHKEISAFRKIKTWLCLLLMGIKVQPSVIEWMNQISLYKIKKRIMQSLKI